MPIEESYLPRRYNPPGRPPAPPNSLPLSAAARTAVPPQAEAQMGEVGMADPLTTPTSMGPDPNPQRASANGARWITLVDSKGREARLHSVRDSAEVRRFMAIPGVRVDSTKTQPAAMMTEQGARDAGHADSTAAAAWESLTPGQRTRHALGASIPMLASMIPSFVIPGASIPMALARVGGSAGAAAMATPLSAAMQDRQMQNGEALRNGIMGGAAPAVVETGFQLARPIGRWMTNAAFSGVPNSIRQAHADAVWRDMPPGSPRPSPGKAKLGDYALTEHLPMPGADHSGPMKGIEGSEQVQRQIERALARRNRILRTLGVKINAKQWGGNPNLVLGSTDFVGESTLALQNQARGLGRKSLPEVNRHVLDILRTEKLAIRDPVTGRYHERRLEPQELQSLVTNWNNAAKELQVTGVNDVKAAARSRAYKALAEDATAYLRSLTPPTNPKGVGMLQAANQEVARRIPYKQALEHIEGRTATAQAPLTPAAVGVVTGVASHNPAAALAGVASTTAARTIGLPRYGSRIGRELYNSNSPAGQNIRKMLSSLPPGVLALLLGVGEGRKTTPPDSSAATK